VTIRFSRRTLLHWVSRSLFH